MAGARNGNGLAREFGTTYGAVHYVVVAAIDDTVGSNLVLNDGLPCRMTLGSHLVRNVGIAAGSTSIGGVACLGAGRGGHDAFVAVTMCGDSNGLARKLSVADRAVHYIIIGAVVHAIVGDLVLYNDLTFGVAQRVYIVSDVAVTTTAGVGGVTTVDTGGSSYDCLVGMTGSIHLVSNVGVATGSTSIGGVACLGAGRGGHDAFVAVTMCGDSNGLASELSATDRAVHYIIIGAVFGTGGCHFVLNDGLPFGVAKCIGGDGLTSELHLTHRTVLHAIIGAGIGTISGGLILNHRLTRFVAESIDHFLLHQNFVTDRAVLTFGQAGLGAGRLYFGIFSFHMNAGPNAVLIFGGRSAF